MKIFNIFFLIVLSFKCLGQDYFSDKYLDSIIKNKIIKEPTSLREVALMLKQDDGNQFLQYSLLAKWLVNHLNYNPSSVYSASIDHSFSSRQGVCYHYSKMMDSLAKYCGFNSKYIRGNAKVGVSEKGKIDVVDHAWNSVFIDGEYYYSDLAWCDVESTKKNDFDVLDRLYFLQKPEIFILSHFPRKKKFNSTNVKRRNFFNSPAYFDGFYLLNNLYENNILSYQLVNEGEITIDLTPINDVINFEILGIELFYCNKSNLVNCEVSSDFSLIQQSNKKKYRLQIENQERKRIVSNLILIYKYKDSEKIIGASIMEFIIK